MDAAITRKKVDATANPTTVGRRSIYSLPIVIPPKSVRLDIVCGDGKYKGWRESNWGGTYNLVETDFYNRICERPVFKVSFIIRLKLEKSKKCENFSGQLKN